ncbi:efflux transporter outer membrane subunit [Pantoea sp. At-9b]|jgi:outer membrane protein, multidrug efflux system|uniref:efflux transporter outer membrane subunit n=1 Tax=Pantoea sp. (strain At-9b) TaxID=592316 RepID=UPI0001B40DE3|nr:efflux transporter outer membrane subunit [Pantoea sp. At-9b]ADU70443.1 RND efflux system, outer membrane lipoprotein, NodT family [Pantoea sp. At-9b]
MITKTFNWALLPLAAALGLTGCTMEPHYQRPSMPVDAHYDQPTAVGNVADLPWQNFFADATMRNLIQLSLDNNRDLRVAALNVEEARNDVTVQRAALMPSIDATASQTSAHEPGNLYNTKTTGPVTYHELNAGLGVTSWELDFFGRLRSLRDQAQETYLSTAATERATRISLISEVATAWLTLCSDNDLLHLAQSTAQSQQDSYRLTKMSYDGGVSSDQDLAESESTVRAAEADVASYTRQVRQDVDALRLLVGTDLPVSLLSHASLDANWQFPATPAGLPSDLLTRRPDVMAAEHTLKAANANIGAARAAFFPSITLTASGGSTSSSLGSLLGAGTGAWSFVPSINLPIFDGGKNQANLNIAHIEKRIEIANYEKAIQTAFKEVNDALAGQDTWQDQMTALQKEVGANQRDYDYSELRYKQGVDNYLNVLVAQRSLYSAQQSLISAHLGQLSQKITLYKALGGGWKS